MKTKRIMSVAFILGLALALSGAGQQTAEQSFKAGLYEEEVGGNLQKAIEIYQGILMRFPDNREVAAMAQLHIGLCHEKLGTKEAEKAFQKVIDNYPEQSEAVREAKEKLSLLLKTRALMKTGDREFKLRQVWAGPLVDILGEVSPNGRYLSFVDWVTGDLAIRELATGTNQRLTNKGPWTQSGEFALFSKWSPDSRQIVYQWYNKDETYDLRVIDVNDPNPRILYPNRDKEDYIHPFTWSPDGKSILAGFFGMEGLRAEIISRLDLISVADGSAKALKNQIETHLDDPKPWGFVFSPDGKYIAYDIPQEKNDEQRDIFLLSAEGGTEVPLIEHPARDTVIDWTPGGEGLLFLSNRTGTQDVWFIRIAGGKPLGSPQPIQPGVGEIMPMGITSRGEFYYGLSGNKSDVYEVGIDAQTGKILSPVKKAVMPYEGHNGQPDYSPDGKLLAYIFTPRTMFTPSAQNLGILSLETGRVRQLNPDLKNYGYPEWAPDGRSISVEGTGKDGRPGLFRVDVQTGDVVPILVIDEKVQIYSHRWSNDGKVIYCSTGDIRGKSASLFAHDVLTGEDKPLSGAPSSPQWFDISPDGKWLALMNRHGKRTIKIMPATGGAPREIYSFELEGNRIIPAWSADGRYIYFCRSQSPPAEALWDLYRISANGGEPEKIDVTMAAFRHLSVHPDGQHLAFSSIGATPQQSQVWVMENFLPVARAALEKDSGEVRIRKVWGNAIDSFFMGALSPDGRYLTYIDWEKFANLGVRDLLKGENRLLTDIKSWEYGEMCYSSVFSPDGNKIAYSFQTKAMLNQLRIVNLDGSSTRIVFDGKDVPYQVPFSWTADGKQILTVFYAKDNSAKIVSVSLADGSAKELKGPSLKLSRTTKMSLSPDGKYIACSYRPREDSDTCDIALLPTGGGQETVLIEHPADDVVLGWSSDGRQVLFMSDRTGGIGTWSVRVSGGKAQGTPELIKGDMGNLRPLGMTRDGKLYYGIHAGWSDIFIASIDPATGKILAPPTKAVRKYETFNSAPDWSPDGQWLVCRSSRGKSAGETPALLIRSVRTNEVREVNPKKAGGLNFHYIRWSPDGQSVLAVGQDENGKYGALVSIDIQSGETKIIVRSDKDDPAFAPNWDPDGKVLYFLRSGKEFLRAMRFDLETVAEKEIARARQGIGTYWLMLSPNGRELVISAENKIKVISSDGAESLELMENKDVTAIAWMADGKNILYGKLQPGSRDVADLWSVPATGGEPQKLGLAMSRLMHLRVSPDGKSIAFTGSEQPGKTEVWVMENFLPAEKK